MKIFSENDVICLQGVTEVHVIGKECTFIVPKGSTGTVVLVHEYPNEPLAYEVEFFIPEQNCHALATVDVSLADVV
ncbi:MAG: hypothetical protein LBU45_01305 [Azoarcus sp.]|jgi:hypothetical protein|nr:hypothetical protein [Azoarcus sp.]